MGPASAPPPDPPDPGSIEERLRELAPPRARASFREALRARFTAGAGAAEGAPRSRSQANPGSRIPSDPALRDHLPHPDPAAAEFREALRRAFVAGNLAAMRAAAKVRTARPAAAVPRLRRPAAWAALAAAVLLVAVLGARLLAPGEPWSVELVEGRGLVVDGRAVGAEPGARLLDALASGLSIETGGARVFVSSRDGYSLELEPESELRFVAGAQGSAGVVELARGEVLFGSPAARGSGVRVRTPEADVAITGTVVSVMTVAAGTCVCVTRGSVEVREHDAASPALSVGAERACFVFADGSEPLESALRENPMMMTPEKQASHLAPLLAFGERFE